MLELTRIAFQGAPDYLKYFIYSGGLVGVVGLVTAGVFGARGEKNQALITVLCTMGFFLVISLVVSKIVSQVIQSAVPAQAAIVPAPAPPVPADSLQVLWSRPVPKFPLDAKIRGEITKALEDIRLAAFAWLKDSTHCPKDQQPESLEKIRANIFFPGYREPPPGESCVLAMSEGCRSGMEGHPDADITFRPGQGLAGIVFIKEEQRKALTSQGPQGEHHFESVHYLTPEQQKKLHPELRWVISFPLKVKEHEGDRTTAGVLGVDGLAHQPSETALDLLMANLWKLVGPLTDKIDTLPKSRVLVGYRKDA